MLSSIPVPAGNRRLVRAIALVVPLAALAAAANPAWIEQQELTASDGVPGDQFGWSVSVSGNTAVVGAASRYNAQGAAYVLVSSGGAWSRQQELTASDGAADDQFGYSVSVNGDTAVIGAWGKTINSQLNQGAAYVFVRSGGVWTEQQELTAPDGAGGDGFGWSVSVSGDTAMIGAPGAAYVFVRSGGAWIEQQELTASDSATGDYFGYSVSVTGSTALIGAASKNAGQGAAYVFVLGSNGVWGQQQELTASDGAAGDSFGYSVSMSGATAVIGAPGKSGSQGAAYGFALSAGAWGQQQKLTASDGAAGDSFGNSVSVSGSAAVIAAYHKNSDQGAAYVFALAGSAWGQQQELTASDGVAGDYFGICVSVSGNMAMIGAIGNNSSLGAGYVFGVEQAAISGVSVSGGGANIAQNAWVSIYGSDLAPASVGAGGLTWSSAPSFAAGQMPTELQGVSVTVTVNGQPAYIYFINPTQVNVLTPLDSTTGPVAVTVNNGSTTSAPFTANLQAVAPGFLRFADGVHIAAEHADYSLLGPASLSVPGYTFTPAAPGETILLFGDGFGLPVSTLTAGSDVQTGALPTLPQLTIGGATATVQFAGLISPGLYQINVVVPSTATNGDNQVIATYGGASSPTGAMIPVSQ